MIIKAPPWCNCMEDYLMKLERYAQTCDFLVTALLIFPDEIFHNENFTKISVGNLI